jgi:hypothetical protein
MPGDYTSYFKLQMRWLRVLRALIRLPPPSSSNYFGYQFINAACLNKFSRLTSALNANHKMLCRCQHSVLKPDLTGYVFHKSVTKLTHNGAANISDSRHISRSNNG